MTAAARNTPLMCDHCGLSFSGGYSPAPDRHFCCYGCYIVQGIVGEQAEGAPAAWILLRLGVGAFLSMSVMMISMIIYASRPGDLDPSTVRAFNWAMLVLSTPAMAILAGSFIRGALADLRRKYISTDALIVTGSLAAYGVSAVRVILGPGPVYFDTATMLLVIMTVGRLVEANAKANASRAIREALQAVPATAHVMKDGLEVETPVAEVRVGDKVIVRPGETFPADGLTLDGECVVEESTFTGESCPRSCPPGSAVYGGSINCDGFITVEVTAAEPDSALSQIKRMVHEAHHGRAPYQRVTERISSVFTPAVWGFALATGAYWSVIQHDYSQAGMSALAVLVVACPCALGLAAPIASAIAIGRAAKQGVLVRSGETLERLSRVRKMYLDKTGTLTTGELTVADVMTVDGVSPEQALAWAAAVELGSEHGIGKAIVRAAREAGAQPLVARNFRVVAGVGVEGTIGDDTDMTVSVGSRQMPGEPEIPESLSLGDHTRTAAYVSIDGVVTAVILLEDSVRPEARETAAKLTDLGVAPSIISGDREAATAKLAEAVGIEVYHSQCAPQDKLELVRRESRVSGLVAMVGDGINDAPALAEADIGIGMAGGADLSRQASDVVLLGDDLLRVPWLVVLSRDTTRIIRQSLLWTLGYNLVAIALAFAGLLHPLIAAVAMLVSSVTVTANSSRLLQD